MADTIPFPTGNAALNARFSEAGTTAEHDPATGRTVVANWPAPRVSNPNFLSEMLADLEAAHAAEEVVGADTSKI